MITRRAVLLLLAIVTTTRGGELSAAGDAAVTEALKPICEEFEVPALAAAVVTSEGIRLVGAAGVRKRGEAAAVTLADLWHLGSDNQSDDDHAWLRG